jgi:ParB-like chromosome segregation protein Spo0J
MHGQKMVPLGKLRLAEYNPRVMPDKEMLKLQRSLSEFGFVEPVVARDDGLIIGGHQRVSAYRTMLVEGGATEEQVNATKVPVVVLTGVTDERARQLNLALNRIHGEWDYDRLADLFKELSEQDEAWALTGFDKDEISDLLEACSLTEGQPLTLDETVDADVAESKRRLAFTMESDAQANECRAVLRAYGMTRDRDAAPAFLRAMQAAMVAKNKEDKPDGSGNEAN